MTLMLYKSTVEDTRTKSMLGETTSEEGNTFDQHSYKILDIIEKILPIITPNITLLFSLQVGPNTN